MKFEFQCLPSLPKLAWGARLRKDEPVLRVLHGPQVEIREDDFFEGAWDGPFETFRFDQAATVAGSGARLENGHVVFCGPSHVYERFFSVRVDDGLFVSNSLAFLLALSGERLDPHHRHYYWDFLDFLRIGIKVKQKFLRLQGARFIEFHDACNLRIDPDLTATRIEKPMPPAPEEFAGYRWFLERTLKAMIANASHEQRRWRYRPVTMLSQGYDSTAVSALASSVGCREAVTFGRSGGKTGYEDDSGAAIAPHLGLNVTEYERSDFEKLSDFRPDEFYIEPWGADRAMAVMEQQIAGSLLLSGRGANNLWPREGGPGWGFLSDTGLPDLQDPDKEQLAGGALGEFRLRTGFIDFPPGSSGAIHGPAIHAIGRSKALMPWSLGSAYDKPIARRIAEEASVPRHLFGQSKKGGPARPERESLLGGLQNRLGHWMPWRVLHLRLFGNRRHPRWSEGSLAVQRCMDAAIKRYLAVLPQVESTPCSESVATIPDS